MGDGLAQGSQVFLPHSGDMGGQGLWLTVGALVRGLVGGRGRGQGGAPPGLRALLQAWCLGLLVPLEGLPVGPLSKDRVTGPGRVVL